MPRASASRPSAAVAPKAKASPSVRQTPPHEVRPQARSEPTVHQPTRQVDGSELGARAEDELAKVEEGRARRAEKAEGAADEPSGESGEPGASSGRGPDTYERHRRTYQDRGTNPQNPSDWTNFAIGKVTRVLRTDNESAIRATLRSYMFDGGMPAHNK